MIPIAPSALLNFNTNPVALKLVECVDSLSSLNASHEILSNFPQLLEACQIFFSPAKTRRGSSADKNWREGAGKEADAGIKVCLCANH